CEKVASASSSTPACTDSDGGADPMVRGVAQGSAIVLEDFCAYDNTVMEAHCTVNGPVATQMDCPFGCADGACMAQPACTDSDGGMNPHAWGYAEGKNGAAVADRCLDGMNLAEAYCSPTGPLFVPVSCSGICVMGVCFASSSSSSSSAPSISCTESDGGLSPAVWGYASGSDGTIFTDQCADSTTIIEAYCSVSGPAVISVACPVACNAGACVTTSIVSSAWSPSSFSSSDGSSASSISSSSSEPVCGNGILESGESCEPGVINCLWGLYCDRESCACIAYSPHSSIASSSIAAAGYTSVCGNGILDPGEQCESGISCDQGWLCGVGCLCSPPAASRSSVQHVSSSFSSSARSVASVSLPPPSPVCWNGELEIGEECESGISCFHGFCDDCRCVASSSSSSSRQQSSEAVVSSAGSSDGACGNGRADGGEQCDDGNLRNGDGCSSVCLFEYGYACLGRPSRCFPVCGDRIVVFPEECDDGNAVDGDGCSSVCKRERAAFSSSFFSSSFFSSSVPLPLSFCGDGVVEDEEQCDDRNFFDGDGCSHLCLIEHGIRSSAREFSVSSSVSVFSSSSVLSPLHASAQPSSIWQTVWLWGLFVLFAIMLVVIAVLWMRGRRKTQES
ncbi:MAG: DUF4215 domain-containing protein, partial [Candidatus Peribacteraceae bacterium]|nr:DUF4215 domain-containing protein [Candidatus Peribacteraceae bacterium]